MNNFIGYVTTVADVTQKSAESVGESFKTIYSRFSNVAAGKFVASQEEMESPDYDENNFSSLNDIEKVLSKIGIKVRENAKDWRAIDDILADIADKWQTWDLTTKNAVATAVAGTRQRENVITLFENWDDVAMYAEIAENAYGTATKKMEAYTDSVEAAKTRMTVAVEELALNLNQSDALKLFYNAITFLTKNLWQVGLVLAGYALFSNPTSVISSVGNVLSKVGMRLVNSSNVFSQTGATGQITGNAIANAKANFKEVYRQKEISLQQQRYGTALESAASGLTQMQANNAKIIQNQLLQMSVEDKKTMSDILLLNTQDASISTKIRNLSLEGQKNLIDAILLEGDEVLSEEKRRELTNIRNQIDAGQDVLQADEKLAAVTEALAAQRQNGNLAGNASGAVGTNLGQAAQERKAALLGFGTMAGTTIGGIAGGNLAKGLGGNGTAQTFASAGGAVVGSVALKGLAGGIAASGAGGAGFTSGVASALGFAGTSSAVPVIGWAVAIATLAGTIIWGVISNLRKKHIEQARQDYNESIDKFQKMSEGISNASKYEELAKGVSNLGHNVSLTNEEYTEFINLGNELGQLYPSLISGVDEYGNSMLIAAAKAGTLTDSIKELLDKQRHESYDTLLNGTEAFEEDFRKAKKGYNTAKDKQNTAERQKQEVQGKLDRFTQELDNPKTNVNRYGTRSPMIRKNEFTEQLIGDLSSGTNSNFISKDEGIMTYYIFSQENFERAKNILIQNDYAQNYESEIQQYEQEAKRYEQEADKYAASLKNYVEAVYQKMFYGDYDLEDHIDYSNVLGGLGDATSSVLNNIAYNVTNLSDYANIEDYQKAIRENVYKYAQILNESDADFIEYYNQLEGTEDLSELSQIRTKFLQTTLNDLFGKDGWTEEEKEIVRVVFQWEFDHVEQNEDGTSTAYFNDMTDAVYRYSQALGISEEELKENAELVAWLYSLTPDSLDNVIDLVKQGYLNEKSSAEATQALINTTRTRDTAYDKRLYANQLANIGNHITTEYGTNKLDLIFGQADKSQDTRHRTHKTFSLDDVTEELASSGMSTSLLNLVQQLTEQLNKGDITVQEAMDAYQEALDREVKNAFSDARATELHDVFPEIEDGVIDSYSEMKSVVDSLTDSMDKLAEAQEEFNTHGTLSIETALSLLESDSAWASALEFSNGQIKISANALDILTQSKIAAAKASMIEGIQQEISELQELEAEIDTLKDKTDEESQVQYVLKQQEYNQKYDKYVADWNLYNMIGQIGETPEQRMIRLQNTQANLNSMNDAWLEYQRNNSNGGEDGKLNGKWSTRDHDDRGRVKDNDLRKYIEDISKVGSKGLKSTKDLTDILGDENLANYVNETLEGLVDALQDGTVSVNDAYQALGDTLGTSQEDIQKQLEWANAEYEVSLNFENVDIDGIIDTYGELADALGSVADMMDKVAEAQKEQATNGKLSWQTALDLLATDSQYANVLEVEGTNIRLSANAADIMAASKLRAAQGSLAAAIAAKNEEVATLQSRYANLQNAIASNATVGPSNSEAAGYGVVAEAAMQAAYAIAAMNSARNNSNFDLKMLNTEALKGKSIAKSYGTTRSAGTAGIDVGGEPLDADTLAAYEREMREIERRLGTDSEGNLLLDSDEAWDENHNWIGGTLGQEISHLQAIWDGIDALFDSDTGNFIGADQFRNLWDNGGATAGSGGKDNDDEISQLEKIKKLLGVINEEYEDMIAYKNQDGLYSKRYYEYQQALLEMQANEAKAQLDAMGGLALFETGAIFSLSKEQMEDALGYYQDYTEAIVKRNNLDDAEIEKQLDILDAMRLQPKYSTELYKQLIETADTTKERLEYENKYLDSLKEEHDYRKKIRDYERETVEWSLKYLSNSKSIAASYNTTRASLKADIADTQNEMAQYIKRLHDRYLEPDENGNTRMTDAEAWEAAYQDETVIGFQKDMQGWITEYGDTFMNELEQLIKKIDNKINTLDIIKPDEWGSLDDIDKYYSKNISYLQEKMKTTYDFLMENASELTDDQIDELVDSVNELTKAIKDAHVAQLNAAKDYHDKVYSAAVNEINRYIDDINREKDAVEKSYDKQIEKLNDKADAIDRTNKLLELQMALENSMNEKQRVYREGKK